MKGRITKAVFVLMACVAASPGSHAQDSECASLKDDGTPVRKGSAVVFKTARLNVDADGAPNSYLIDGTGLSFTCDGVVAVEDGKDITPESDPKNWQKRCNDAWRKAKDAHDYSGVRIFGFLTDDQGKPLPQGEGDPIPGKAYISTTSVTIPDAPEMTQLRYVDATRIPYVVLPGSFRKKYGVQPGSLAIVYRQETKAIAFAIYGDAGRKGEASVKLHLQLGARPIVVRNGIERAKAGIDEPVLTVVFPDIVARPRKDTEGWLKDIQSKGAAALEEFGGDAALSACAE